MDVIEIIALENGPYIVTYKRNEGEKKIALCRCGASQHSFNLAVEILGSLTK